MSDVVVSSELIGTIFCVRLEMEIIGDVFEDGDDGLEDRGHVFVGNIPVVIVGSAVLETFS